jgi:hypothetical protein
MSRSDAWSGWTPLGIVQDPDDIDGRLLYECPECGAAVDQYARAKHENWHHEVQTRGEH